MSKVKDGGIVTAYGAAVRGGYAGTYQQFCDALGQLAEVLEEFEDFSVTVETLAPGQSATASYENGVLHLGIPKGETGNGIQSATLNQDYTLTLTWTNGQSTTVGPIRGETGQTPNLTVGTVQTLEPEQSATVTITGTPEDPVLNFGIPKGESGGGDAGDITFDPEEDYDEGTVGAELSQQKNAIDQIEEAVEIENFGVDLYNPDDPDVLRGQYYDGDILKTAAALGQSGYIPVEVNHYYTSNVRNVFVQLYDDSKAFVQKILSDDFARLGYVLIPTGIAYARFIFLTASENTFKIWETNASGADSPTVPYLKQEDIGAAGINLRFVAGAIRKTSADSDWGLINDSAHAPLNLTNVSVNSSGDLVVEYGFTAKRVITLVVAPDETYANNYSAGASVALDKATITFYDTARHVKINANDLYNANGNFWLYGVMDA